VIRYTLHDLQVKMMDVKVTKVTQLVHSKMSSVGNRCPYRLQIWGEYLSYAVWTTLKGCQ